MGSDREHLTNGNSRNSKCQSRNKPFLRFTLAVFIVVPLLAAVWNFLVFKDSYDDEVELKDGLIADWEAEDPRLIRHIQRNYLYPPSPREEPYHLLFPDKRDWSHKRQSMVVDEILGSRRNGVFFEAGAYDGETYSNSLYFEKHLNWTGVLVEPDDANIKRFLSKKRKSWLVKGCLAGKSKPEKMTFFGAMEVGAISDESLTLTKRWLTQLWRPTKKTQVWCFPLISVLRAVNMTRLDYMVIDIEGAEMPVLRGTPWTEVDVDVVQVEYAVFGGAYWNKDQSHARLREMRIFMSQMFPKHEEYARIFLDLIYAKQGMLRPKNALDSEI